MSAAPNRWTLSAPSTRRGASHVRRGLPCQDASEVRELRSLDDRPVWVMCVADGHGGPNYLCSDVGSRLACERALAEISGTLLRRRLGGEDPGAWEPWLKTELPRAIHLSWLKACRRHWEGLVREAEADAEAADARGELGGRSPADLDLPTLADFQPYLYGTTLGVVVMTPSWWGHTGLGDWDLTRVWQGGRVEMVSCEPPALEEGEITASLAHDRAWELFAPRSSLHPLSSRERPFALVLSTDGLRKSCPSDADHLSLNGYLARAALPEDRTDEVVDLDEALDRITEEGSGDDVSVAIAVHGRLRLGGTPAPAPDAAAAEEGPAAAGEVPPPSDAPEDAGGGRSLQPRLADDPGLVRARRKTRRPHSDEIEEEEGGGLPWPLALLLVAAVLAVSAPLIWRLMLGVSPPVAPAAGLKIQDELQRLCRGPNVMRRNLRTRRDVFEGLVLGRLDPAQLQADAARDPLAALIASSFDPSSRSMRDSRTIAGFETCPALLQELQRQWALDESSPEPR